MDRLSIYHDAHFLRIMTKSKSEIRLERFLKDVFGSIESGLRERYEQMSVNVARRRFLRSVILSDADRFFRLNALLRAYISMRYRGEGCNAIRDRESKRLIREGSVRRRLRVLRKASECAYLACIARCAFIIKIMTAIDNRIRDCKRAFLSKDRVAAMGNV